MKEFLINCCCLIHEATAIRASIKGRMKKLSFFHASFFYKYNSSYISQKAYNPLPNENAIMNPMRQLQLFSACCDIYKDCVR